MEAYRGLAILTTNLEGALDQAFLRRLRFVVRFPFPDAAQRREIWRAHVPAGDAARTALDADVLARLDVAGGNIRNIGSTPRSSPPTAARRCAMEHVARGRAVRVRQARAAALRARAGGCGDEPRAASSVEIGELVARGRARRPTRRVVGAALSASSRGSCASAACRTAAAGRRGARGIERRGRASRRRRSARGWRARSTGGWRA